MQFVKPGKLAARIEQPWPDRLHIISSLRPDEIEANKCIILNKKLGIFNAQKNLACWERERGREKS